VGTHVRGSGQEDHELAVLVSSSIMSDVVRLVAMLFSVSGKSDVDFPDIVTHPASMD
jgi:hypothetical protein